MIILKRILPIICLLSASASFAQEAGEPQLKVTPTGRALIDGAAYASPMKEEFPDGMAIPEVRLGAKMAYDKWTSNIDVCFAYSKIGLRNMWVEYGFDKHNSLRIGNFIHQFGLQSTSNSLKSTFEQPTASALFYPGLQLGAMFVHYSDKFFTAFSGHVESAALTQYMNEPLFVQQGYGLLTRLVYRHANDNSPIWHAGISGGFATPQRRVEDNEDVHDGFTISANYPTKVVQKQAIGVTVDKAMNQFRFTPEFLFASGPLAFEAQYFFQQVNRRENLRAFKAQSGYATLRTMITGGNYSYVSSTAQLANPKRGALECVLNYNYSTLSDSKAGIYGGRCNVASATLNYYINPYITARLNYAFIHTWQKENAGPDTLNVLQARLMVFF